MPDAIISMAKLTITLRMQRKLVILAFSAIVVMLLVVFFRRDGGNDTTSHPVETPPQKISFFHYFSGTLSGGIDEMVATVNRQSPGYSVLASGLDHEAFKTMIPASLERGNPPELFSYWAGERVQALVAQEQLQPIDDLWERENLSSQFSPTIIDSAVTYDGRKYLLPITQHIVLFFYNKKVFEEHKLTVPETWFDFLDICKKLRASAVVPIALGARERWPAQFWFDYLLIRTAGPDYRRRLMAGKQSYTDPEVLRSFQLWSYLFLSGYFNSDANQLDWAEATALVREGKAAMTLMGTWATQVLEDGATKLSSGSEYDFFRFPVMTDGLPLVAIGPIDGIVMSKTSSRHEFAQKVLTYFAGREAQEIMSTGSGAISPNHTVPDTFYSPFKLRLKQEIARADQWCFAFDLATPSAIADMGLNSFNELIEFPLQFEQILVDLQQEIDAAQLH